MRQQENLPHVEEDYEEEEEQSKDEEEEEEKEQSEKQQQQQENGFPRGPEDPSLLKSFKIHVAYSILNNEIIIV